MKCPLLNKDCIKEKCAWWTRVAMRNVQNGEIYFEEKCAVNAISPMMVEMLKLLGGVQGAVESSRNESVDRQDKLLEIISGAARRAQIAAS